MNKVLSYHQLVRSKPIKKPSQKVMRSYSILEYSAKEQWTLTLISAESQAFIQTGSTWIRSLISTWAPPY